VGVAGWVDETKGWKLILAARNGDLWAFLESMKQMEDRFNHWAKYDYVFLNDDVSGPPYHQSECELML
jgi:hypothetical protein